MSAQQVSKIQSGMQLRLLSRDIDDRERSHHGGGGSTPSGLRHVRLRAGPAWVSDVSPRLPHTGQQHPQTGLITELPQRLAFFPLAARRVPDMQDLNCVATGPIKDLY